MKVHPEDPRPQCFQTPKPRRPALFQGEMSNALTLAAPKTQTLEGEAYQHNTWLLLHHRIHNRGCSATPLTPQLCSLIFSLPFSSFLNTVQVKATRLVISS